MENIKYAGSELFPQAHDPATAKLIRGVLPVQYRLLSPCRTRLYKKLPKGMHRPLRLATNIRALPTILPCEWLTCTVRAEASESSRCRNAGTIATPVHSRSRYFQHHDAKFSYALSEQYHIFQEQYPDYPPSLSTPVSILGKVVLVACLL